MGCWNSKHYFACKVNVNVLPPCYLLALFPHLLMDVVGWTNLTWTYSPFTWKPQYIPYLSEPEAISLLLCPSAKHSQWVDFLLPYSIPDSYKCPCFSVQGKCSEWPREVLIPCLMASSLLLSLLLQTVGATGSLHLLHLHLHSEGSHCPHISFPCPLSISSQYHPQGDAPKPGWKQEPFPDTGPVLLSPQVYIF